MTATSDAVAFFLEYGGYGYNAATETREEGRLRCARGYAAAEAWLVEQPGFTVEWVQDRDYDPADYDVPVPEVGWGCIVRANGRTESLWAITFDGDGHPSGNPYARVVVAELASELMPG